MTKRMYAEGEFAPPESERMAAQRLMQVLDESAAGHGMSVTGDVDILASDPHPLTQVRMMRLEADVETR
jgi:hypothetical protein